MLQSKIFRSRWLAITWFIFMCILFFLPGSALPKEQWLTQIDFDKIVHVGLFAVLIFLWRSAFDIRARKNNFLIIFIAFLYGLSVELIQRQWIPNRSFDLYDVAADIIGAVLGLIVWIKLYKTRLAGGIKK